MTAQLRSPVTSSTAGVAYRHVQGEPAADWVVQHDLGYKPAGVWVQMADGTVIDADAEHVSDSELVIHLGSALSGEAFIS